jgi:hypothetical protein
MPFVIRPYRRFATDYPVIYERLYDTGYGNAWNVSPTGFRVSGTLPLQPGDVCSLKVRLPKQVSVLAGVVRWADGDEFGIETLLMDKRDEARLAAYIRDRMQELRPTDPTERGKHVHLREPKLATATDLV